MSLNKKELNSLSVFNLRKLKFIPNHFSKVKINYSIDIKLLDHWINFNLNSRYGIKKTFVLDENKKIIEAIEIGVEDPKELTMLTLGCSFLHKKRI